MNRDNHNRLLQELFDSEELARLRRVSLDHMLASARLRRQRRRIGRAGVFAALSLLLITGVFSIRAPRAPTVRNASSAPANTAASASKATSVTVKIITDEELYALFPNRSLALIGPVGAQRLVFFDNGSAVHPEH